MAKTEKLKSKKKILICEDEKPLAKALELKLKSAGYEVLITYNGKEAIQEFNSDIDIVLLDLILPEIDGFRVLKAIRQKSKKVPVVILSNLGQPEDRIRVKNLGATAYYIKSEMPLSKILEIVQFYLYDSK